MSSLSESTVHVARPRVLGLVAVLMFLPLQSNTAEQICDGSDPKITPSPKGQWTASVQERVCSTAQGGAAAAVTVVVAPKDAPDQGGRVAATAVPRSRDEWPRVVWRSETLLEVWVPNFAHVVEVKPNFRDVAVELKYCGDDPDARARLTQYQVDVKRWMEEVTQWAQVRKRDPQAAGPRPTRPEEPRVERRPCRDSDIP